MTISFAATKQLVDRAQAGDRDAEEKLLCAYHDLIVSRAQRWGGPAHDYGERYQVACLGFLHAVHSWPGSGSFRAYATQSMQHNLINAYRVERRHSSRTWPASQVLPTKGRAHTDDDGDFVALAPDGEEDLAEMTVRRLVAYWLADLVSTALPAQQHAILLLTASGMEHAEVAAHLGVAVGTVKSQLWRARQKAQAVVRAALAEPGA